MRAEVNEQRHSLGADVTVVSCLAGKNSVAAVDWDVGERRRKCMSVGCSAIGTRVLGDRDRVCYWDVLSGRSRWDLHCKIWNRSGNLSFGAGISIIENANASRINAPKVCLNEPLEAKSKEPPRQRSWRRVVVFIIYAVTVWILGGCRAVFEVEY
jgi:hypothetical protein